MISLQVFDPIWSSQFEDERIRPRRSLDIFKAKVANEFSFKMSGGTLTATKCDSINHRLSGCMDYLTQLTDLCHYLYYCRPSERLPT